MLLYQVHIIGSITSWMFYMKNGSNTYKIITGKENQKNNYIKNLHGSVILSIKRSYDHISIRCRKNQRKIIKGQTLPALANSCLSLSQLPSDLLKPTDTKFQYYKSKFFIYLIQMFGLVPTVSRPAKHSSVQKHDFRETTISYMGLPTDHNSQFPLMSSFDGRVCFQLKNS